MTVAPFSAQPADTGLYRREHEHDACGVAFVATMRGAPATTSSSTPSTRCATSTTGGRPVPTPLGDGAGILTQVPDAFFRAVLDVELPPAGPTPWAWPTCPVDADERAAAESRIEEIAAEEGLRVLAWRDVPVTPDLVGRAARDCMPVFRQLFVAARRALRHRARPGGLLPAQAAEHEVGGATSRRSRPGPSSTRAC